VGIAFWNRQRSTKTKHARHCASMAIRILPKLVILARLLHCGNQEGIRRINGRCRLPKKLASAEDLRFNLNKVAYMLVAALKTGD